MRPLTLLVLLAACGDSTPAAPAAKPTAEVEAPKAAALTPTQKATLASADAADGAVDRVISKCPVCMLGMEGDPMHAITSHGYELHACSESCQTAFEADPISVIDGLADAVK